MVKYLLLFIVFANTAFSFELDPREIYDNTSSCIVKIEGYDTDDDLLANGSGVVVDAAGIIWTNFHIFRGSDYVKVVTISGETSKAVLIGADPIKDILILKTDIEFTKSVKPVSSNNIKIGEKVYAMGNPSNTINTFSEGMLSNFFYIDQEEQLRLQYTASISSGSSGGALLNSDGELIGVTSSSFDSPSQNINFAVSSEDFFRTKTIDYNDEKQVEAFYRYCLAFTYKDTRDGASVITALNYCLNVFPDNANALFERGLTYLDFDREKAKADLDKAAGLEPNNGLYTFWRGYLKYMDEDYESAVLDFTTAINLNPYLRQPYWYLAEYYSGELNNTTEALKYIDLAIKFQPREPYSFILKGNIFLNNKDSISAVQWYAHASFLDSTFLDGYIHSSNLCMKMNYYEEALTMLNFVIKKDDEYSEELYYNRAICYRSMGEPLRALKDFNEDIMRSGSRREESLTGIGYCHIDAADYDEAKKSFIKALTIKENLWEAHLGLAVAECKLGNMDEAVRYFKKAAKSKSELKKGIYEIRKAGAEYQFTLKGTEIDALNEICKELGLKHFEESNIKTGVKAQPK